MPRTTWNLLRGRPCVQIELTIATGNVPLRRTLIADTGAGTIRSTFELILDENDCLLCGGAFSHSTLLGGAFSGTFPVYTLRVIVPALGFDLPIRVVGVPSLPTGFDGIACFRFVSRFAYGNFGMVSQFGLEC